MKLSIPHIFSNTSLLNQALSHKSFSLTNSNERLEFLGDSLLGFFISDWLYRRSEKLSEKDMSLLRASLVNKNTLAILAEEMELSKHLKVNKREAAAQIQKQKRILASTLEALIGAVYLDVGYEGCQNFVLTIFKKILLDRDLSKGFELDYKTKLQEKSMKLFKQLPVYQVKEKRQQEGKTVFVVKLSLSDIITQGQGLSHKEAEQQAAQKALEKIKGNKL